MIFSVNKRAWMGLRFALVCTAVLLLAFLAWWIAGRGARKVAPQATATEAPPATGFRLTTAQWASLKIEPVSNVRFDSVVVADGVIATNDTATASVYSPFSGRVTAIHAQLGQMVRKGAALVTVLATETSQSNSDVAAATGAESSALKQFELAQLTEHRQHELLLAEAGTQKDWLQSQTDLAVAENGLRAARASLVATRERAAILGGGPSKQTLTAGQGLITAPIDGVIVQRQVAPGQFVSSLSTGGSTALFTVADLRTVWVLASVTESDATGLKLGQPVEVSALALPGRVFRARVSWVASMVDPATHRVIVRAELPNLDGQLKPQMSITARVLEGHPADVIAVARSALIYDGQLAHCYVVTGERTLAVRAVQVGRAQGGMSEVTSGLSVGDRIVTRGTLFMDRVAEDSAS